MPGGDQQLSKTSQSQKYALYARYLSTTMRYVAEILVVIILAVASYASLQKGALKIQLQPPPVPFLKNNSSVKDYYGGDIATPFSEVLHSDVSLVMYYAPWDFDSQLAIQDFEKIANKYRGQVLCASINCWIQNGACKKTFPKLRSFPLILAYVGGNRGIQYRGPLQYEYINKFVQSLLKPLERVETVNDFYKLMTKATGVITGYFNFSTVKPDGFYSFYVTALRSLEFDVHKSIVFAVVTNLKAANRLGIHCSSSKDFDLRLHLWNETLIYPRSSKIVEVNRFLQWIQYRTHSPIQWVWPSNRKNQLIQHYLIDPRRPSVILFTPFLNPSQYTMMMKEVALEYNNCASSPRVRKLIQEIRQERFAAETSKLALQKRCSINEKEIRSANTTFACMELTTVWKEEWNNSDNCITPYHMQFEYNFSGLSCRTNRSLNFLTIDTELYPHFLNKLGYSLKEVRQNPNAFFIIDPKDESHYVMNEPVTFLNLKRFIFNFTENNVMRYRRSKKSKANQCPKGRICIKDISAEEFQNVVLNPASDAIVFYRKSGCIFCGVGARAFIKVSEMFSTQTSFRYSLELNEIRFVTINGEENDLPWHYTAEKYPSIIFYPANRKSDSRIYPNNLELNEINLLNFTLSQLSVRHRVMWFVHFCQKIVTRRPMSCLQEAQQQIRSHLAVIDQQIRRIHHGSAWFDDSVSMRAVKLRDLLKERFFSQELGYLIRKTIVESLRTASQNGYPDGVRFAS